MIIVRDEIWEDNDKDLMASNLSSTMDATTLAPESTFL